MSESYKTIFLQWGNHSDWESLTWCQDRIDDDDVEYIRKDLHDAAVADLLEACEMIVQCYGAESYINGTQFEIEMVDKAVAAIAKVKGES